MKMLSVRIPDHLDAEIASEARARHMAKAEVIRERLQRRPEAAQEASSFDAIADLVGALPDDGGPTDVSARKKHYLREWGYGEKRRR